MPTEPPKTVDGYDRQRLTECLQARGLITDDEIIGIQRGGARIDYQFGDSVWILPRWIADAKLSGEKT